MWLLILTYFAPCSQNCDIVEQYSYTTMMLITRHYTSVTFNDALMRKRDATLLVSNTLTLMQKRDTTLSVSNTITVMWNQ